MQRISLLCYNEFLQDIFNVISTVTLYEARTTDVSATLLETGHSLYNKLYIR